MVAGSLSPSSAFLFLFLTVFSLQLSWGRTSPMERSLPWWFWWPLLYFIYVPFFSVLSSSFPHNIVTHLTSYQWFSLDSSGVWILRDIACGLFSWCQPCQALQKIELRPGDRLAIYIGCGKIEEFAICF